MQVLERMQIAERVLWRKCLTTAAHRAASMK
jgi:hypothetical protein